jgi:hypothetical protein
MEQNMLDCPAERWAAMFAMDRRGHDDRICVAIDGLIDDRWTDRTGL